jgi:hypothetical protein
MKAGNIKEPVALRGVHGQMRSTDTRLMDECRRLRWKMLDEWFKDQVRDKERRRLYRRAYADFKMRDSSKFEAVWELMKSILTDSSSLLDSYGRFDLNLLAVSDNSKIAVRALSAKNRLIRSLRG